MAALQYVIKVIECDTNIEASPVLEELQELDNELNEFLKREY